MTDLGIPLYSAWWLLAGFLVLFELLTGTFYLLMLALGSGAGAIAAHLGFSFEVQQIVAATVGVLAVAAWQHYREANPAKSADANPAVHLDIGEPVDVTNWTAAGTAVVLYRGAHWAAHYSGQNPPQAGAHRIVAVNGSRLILSAAQEA